MSYEIRVTRAAERDIGSAVDYIDRVLLNPQAADELLDEMERAVSGLADFPKMHGLADDPVLKSWGVRFLPVKSYMVFYVIAEESRTVFVVRFLYGKRDWVPILRQGFTLN